MSLYETLLEIAIIIALYRHIHIHIQHGINKFNRKFHLMLIFNHKKWLINYNYTTN